MVRWLLVVRCWLLRGGVEGGDGCGLLVVGCWLRDDGWDGVAGSQFVEGEESSGVVLAGVERGEAVDAALCACVGLDVFIRDGCGSRVLVPWLVAAGEYGVPEVVLFFRRVVAFGRREEHPRQRRRGFWESAVSFRLSAASAVLTYWVTWSRRYKDEAVGFVVDEFFERLGLDDRRGPHPSR